MKKKTLLSKINTINYNTNNISPKLSIDLGDSEKYRSAIEQIRLILSEDRTYGKLIALEVYNSKANTDVSTFFMHRQDAYIVGFINENGINQFLNDDQLRYTGQTTFSLYSIYSHYKIIHMLGFAIAEAVRFYPIAEHLEILIEQGSSSFDITAPIQNKEGKIWYLEEHRGRGTINTMTALTMIKLKTSWKATDGFNKYHLKDPITEYFSGPIEIIGAITDTFSSIAKEIPQSTELLKSIQSHLKIDLSTSHNDLSDSAEYFAQQDSIELIRQAINSHPKTIARYQNELDNLENMRKNIAPNYRKVQEKIERIKAQNKEVPSKLLESEESERNFLDAIEEAIKLTTIQITMSQKLFDLSKVALGTNLAAPYPFHPEATGRTAIVSLNTTDNIHSTTTDEPKTKQKGKPHKHKISSRSSGDDDTPDNDQDGQAIIKNTADINKQTSDYNLTDYYWSWIYQLPKWLQSIFFNSAPFKTFIEIIKYNSRFAEKPITLEKSLYQELESKEHEYEDNINQKAQINYEEALNMFDSYAIKSVVTIGIILPIFIEQKDPLLGLGNNFIEF